MAFLKKKIIYSFLFFGSLPGIGHSAPPVDLSDFTEASRTVRTRKKPLGDKDIIFTDNVIKPEKIITGLVLIKEPTYGRSKPMMKSKAILRFQKDFRVRFVQFSKSKDWVAVELLNKKRKAWVPLKAVQLLDEEQIKVLREFQNNQEQAQEDPGAF